jgi:bacterioferritin-associated ferredoxin
MGKDKKHGKGGKKDVVCSCKHVTRGDIEAAVAEGATSMADVKRMTGAATKCGKCKGRVKAALDQALEERVAAEAPEPAVTVPAPAPAAVPAPDAAASENALVIHGIYRHFKGDSYLVEDVAHDSETGEEVVVYRKLYGDGSLWVRPKAMFLSPVDREKYPEVTQRWRFELQHVESVAGKA